MNLRGGVGCGGSERKVEEGKEKKKTDLITNTVRTMGEHELHDTNTSGDVERRGGTDRVDPARRRLLVGSTNNRGTKEEKRDVASTLKEKVLSERLGERVRVGVLAKKLGRELVDLLRALFKQRVEHLLRIKVQRINNLFNKTFLDAVHICRRDVRESKESLAVLGDGKETERSQDVLVDGIGEGLVEVDRGGRVDEDVDFFLDHGDVRVRHAETLHGDVSRDDDKVLEDELGSVFSLASETVEDTTRHQFVKTIRWRLVLLGSNQQEDLAHVWD